MNGLFETHTRTNIEARASIALNTAFLVPAVQKYIDQHLIPSKLNLRLAKLGETAPLVGAALLPDIPESAILH